MKSTLPMEIIKVMPSNHGRQCRSYSRGAALESARIQGGNWCMLGLRRSSHVHDEDECQMSIAEFISGQERFESID